MSQSSLMVSFPPPSPPNYTKWKIILKYGGVWKTWSNGKPKHKEKAEDIIPSLISPICYEPSSLQVQCMQVQRCSSNSQSKWLCAWNYPKFQFHVSIKTQDQGRQSLKSWVINCGRM
jgi:hypothetical protein